MWQLGDREGAGGGGWGREGWEGASDVQHRAGNSTGGTCPRAMLTLAEPGPEAPRTPSSALAEAHSLKEHRLREREPQGASCAWAFTAPSERCCVFWLRVGSQERIS